jgi:hypothetical protein
MLPSDKAMQNVGEAEETVLLQAKEHWGWWGVRRGGRAGHHLSQTVALNSRHRHGEAAFPILPSHNMARLARLIGAPTSSWEA